MDLSLALGRWPFAMIATLWFEDAVLSRHSQLLGGRFRLMMMMLVAGDEDGIALEVVHLCGLCWWSMDGFSSVISVQKTDAVFWVRILWILLVQCLPLALDIGQCRSCVPNAENVIVAVV